jgi:hypothetical protein
MNVKSKVDFYNEHFIFDENIENEILNGNFEKALQLKESQFKSLEEFKSFIYGFAFKTTNIMIYEFLIYIYKQDKSLIMLKFIVDVLYNVYCCYEGGYNLSLYYQRKVIGIEPDNINNWQQMLSYRTLPEKIISFEEAQYWAKKIVEKDPNIDCIASYKRLTREDLNIS